MISFVRMLGRFCLNMSESIGNSGIILIRSIVHKPDFKHNVPAIIQQIYNEGVLSLILLLFLAYLLEW